MNTKLPTGRSTQARHPRFTLMVSALSLTLYACASVVSESEAEATHVCVPPAPVPATGPATVASNASRHTLASGKYFTCAITDEAKVACWNLGILYSDCGGISDPESAQIIPGVDGVVELAAGNLHVCALRQDGTVVCWGTTSSSMNGQTSRAPAIVPFLTQAETVASGYDHNCARNAYGKVSCWGDNSSDQLGTALIGIRASAEPIVVPLQDDVKALALSRRRSCALMRDGSVACWGSGTSVPVTVEGLQPVLELVANGNYACALNRDTTVACWGDVPGGPSLSKPAPVNNLSGVVEIAAGPSHACARKASGSVTCWGSNTYDQLGTGVQRSLLDPSIGEVFGLTDAEELSLGESHSCARSRSQGVVCWGTRVGSRTPIRVEGL